MDVQRNGRQYPNNINCSTVCAPTIPINGPNIVCNTGTFQYSVGGLPAGVNVNWSATGPVSINPTTGVATATGNGNATITATLPDNCGTVVSRTVSVGGGVVGGTYSYSGYTYPIGNGGNGIGVSNSSISINLNHIADPNATYSWVITSKSSSGAFASFSGKNAYISLSSGKFLNCTCTVNTPCGIATASFSCYNYAFGGWSMMAYPNPSDEELIIETALETPSEEAGAEVLQDKSATSSKAPIKVEGELELLNVYQEVVWQGKLQEGKTKIDTKNLPEGTYYLRIVNDKESVTKRILVKH